MPLPSGYTLDTPPKLPPGYTLDAPEEHPPHGAGGSYEPESKLAKTWRLANTPLISETESERNDRRIANSPPTRKEAEFAERYPRLGPILFGSYRGIEGAFADTSETLRGFTSPLAIATLGLGKLGETPGAVGKLARVASKTAGVGFGAEGAREAYEGMSAGDLKKSLMGTAQAILGGTAAAGRPVQDYATERLPKRIINQLIRPTVADVKFGKTPAQALITEKIVGNSLPEIGDKVFDKLHEVGKEIDRTVQAPKNAAKVIDTSSSLQPIDDAMREATKAGDRGLYARLSQLKQQLTMDWAQTRQGKGIVPVSPRNLKMNPYEATQFKRVVGDATKWTGNDPFENQLNAVKGEIYGNLKKQINQTVPEVVSLNERYSNLVSAGKAIERRIPVAERNAHWSLSDIALGATGHIPLAIARKIATTPAFRTRAAKHLSSLAGKSPTGKALTGAAMLNASSSNPNMPTGEEP